MRVRPVSVFLAGFIRSYADARRLIALALWYPMIVLVLAYSLFVLMVVLVVPRFLSAYESMRVPITPTLTLLGGLGAWVWAWGPLLPALLVVLLANVAVYALVVHPLEIRSATAR